MCRKSNISYKSWKKKFVIRLTKKLYTEIHYFQLFPLGFLSARNIVFLCTVFEGKQNGMNQLPIGAGHLGTLPC